jgi:hypothetical protein
MRSPHTCKKLLSGEPKAGISRISSTNVDFLMQAVKKMYMGFKQTRYISRKPVPGFETGTGGFTIDSVIT